MVGSLSIVPFSLKYVYRLYYITIKLIPVIVEVCVCVFWEFVVCVLDS